MEGNTHISVEPDTSKRYVCFFCEEEVAFLGPTQSMLEAAEKYKKYHDYEASGMLEPRWKHVESGEAACKTFATPSNLEVG